MGSPEIKWYDQMNRFDMSDPRFTLWGQSNWIYQLLGAKWYVLIALTHISLTDISSALTAQEIHFEILCPHSNERRPDSSKVFLLKGNTIYYMVLRYLFHLNAWTKSKRVLCIVYINTGKTKTFNDSRSLLIIHSFIHCLQVLADTTTWL